MVYYCIFVKKHFLYLHYIIKEKNLAIFASTVLNKSKHQEIAQDFLDYLTSEEAGEIFASVGFVPITK